MLLVVTLARQRCASLLASSAFVALVLLGVRPDAAAALSTDQQKCLNDLNKRGSQVVRDQGKVSYACLRDAGRGNLDKLGEPPQAQTAQACLTNDVKGKVAKRMLKVAERDADRCLAEPGQRPGFGYTGAAAINASAQAASLGVVLDLFGADLDLAVVSDDDDRDGARCQQETLKRAHKVLDDMWKEALRHKKDVLKGKNRLTGGDPEGAVGREVELRWELASYVESDPRAKIDKAIFKLTEKVKQRCADALTPLAQMFPGACGGAGDLDALAACAGTRAQVRFYEGLAAFDALRIDCDLLDDADSNGSCEDPELKAHVLNRIGYGPDAWSWQRIGELGVAGYVAEQLAPAGIDDAAADALLVPYPSLGMSFEELRANYPQGGSPGRGQVLRELQRAKMTRAIASRRQLQEILVDFWLNHFNVDATSSGRTRYDISPYDRITLRPNVLGTFRDLLLADARSPAMGDYLDNRRSRVGEINENYGREVLELHTLGVDGGFDEVDVVESSRCFTGWREDYTNAVDGFRFQASWHDEGQKIMFGGALVIGPDGGEQDGIDLVDYLGVHPSTASLVVRKLVVRFVAESPPPDLVAAGVATYLATGGDLHAVLETLLLSDAFLANPLLRGTKVKRPHHLLASAARALAADPAAVSVNELRRNSERMGEAIYEAAPPTGFPDVSGFWTSPGTMVTRFNEIERRARGLDGFDFTYPVTGGTPEEIVDALAAMLLPGGVSDDTRDTTVALVAALAVPDAERVEQAAAVLLSSPEFLQH